MEFFLRRLPGGLLPRFLAFSPLFFPFYDFQGVLFGLSLRLPHLFLGSLLLYFLFEHEPFRLEEWKLWPLILFTGSALFLFGSALIFPLIFFVMARSVFREKPSMVALSLRSFIASAVLMGLFSEWKGPAVFGGIEALQVFILPALLLCVAQIFRFRSRSDFLIFFFAGLFLFSIVWREPPVFLIDSLTDFSALFAISWETMFFAFVMSVSGLWMTYKALLWLPERDIHERFLLAAAYLFFFLLLAFSFGFLTESHWYLFWFFMAALL